MAYNKFVLVRDNKQAKGDDPLPLLTCPRKSSRPSVSVLSKHQDMEKTSQLDSKLSYNSASSLQRLPMEMQALILSYAANDPLSAINLALTCKTFLEIGRFVAIPSDASSLRPESPMPAPASLQSCDLCQRFWLTGGDHDDPERWKLSKKMENQHWPAFLKRWTYVRCPGGGERARTIENLRNTNAASGTPAPRPGTAAARNRLAEELSIFSQALLRG